MPTPLPTTSSSTAPVPATVPFTEAGACWFVDGPIDGAAILAAVAAPAAGGNVLFLGTTRGVTVDVTTRSLDYEAHETVAVAMLDGLRAEAVARFGLCGCAIVHRLGRVVVGEASIAIAASAPHRREAFAATEWLLERVKAAVPIWKCEEDGEGRRTWVHPGDLRGIGERR